MFQHSRYWVLYSYLSFGLSWAFLIFGILALDASLWQKGFFAMGSFFLVGSSFSLAKTIRDIHESDKLVNKIEDAKTEQLLTGMPS